ncbi:MAG: hypothetical protein EBZ75_14440 [Oxalobacteraceae bacterium]|nr:hypothetical protein [Oxalobacteraceae bacterium]
MDTGSLKSIATASFPATAAVVPAGAASPAAAQDASGASPTLTDLPKVNVEEHFKHLERAAATAAQDIQRFIASMQRQVNVSRDSETGYIVVRIVDPESGQTIRSLPPDELLRIARSFEVLGSVMVNQKA